MDVRLGILMPLFGDDPRDETIRLLKDEVQHLRNIEKELRDQLLAVTNASAYRMTHRPEDHDIPHGQPVRSVLETRDEPYKPNKTFDEVKGSFSES